MSLNDPGASISPAALLAGADVPDEKVNILIVDDLPEKLLVFGTVLEDLGQNLVFVRSGREALRELLQREFAVILLDVNMPDIDGFETAAMIRRHPRSVDTPIIFITSYADDIQTERGYALGAVDYIQSPVVPQILRSKVKVFVRLFAMQRQIRRQADAHAAVAAAEAARRAAEESDRRSAFLADASRALSDTLDARVALRRLAALLVPQLGSLAALWAPRDVGAAGADGGLDDGATLLVAHEHGEPQELPAARIAPLVIRTMREAIARSAPAPAAPTPAGDAASELAAIDTVAWGLPHPLRAAPVAAEAIALRNGERLLGVVWLARDARPRALDWRLLDELASRAAAALENARLYEQVQREIVERRIAQAQLQEAGQRKDEFLAMLSHELRNPLAPIRTALEIVRLLAPDEPRLARACEIMVRQLRQMTHLIDELLDVARISQGKIELAHADIELGEVIAHSVETAQPHLDARDQKLRVTVPERMPRWRGDFARIAQILANLLHNASKYSEKGTTIELLCALDERGARVVVRDQGIGIDPELLARIFDLFTQGSRGLDRAQGGLGVGLTLARRLAELHGGSLEARSAGTGHGAEFVLWLPAYPGGGAAAAAPLPRAAAGSASTTSTSAFAPTAAPTAAPIAASTPAPATPIASTPAPAAPAAPAGPAPCRILVVDDNRDAAFSVAALLRLAGHEIATADDGAQALEQAAAFRPDVVVLDIGLPVLDGYEVAARLRSAPGGDALLLLALTGYGQLDDRASANAAGFDDHFVKPADPDALVERIARWNQQRDGGAAARPLARHA